MSLQLPPQISNFLGHIDKNTSHLSLLTDLEKKSTIPRSYVVIVVGLVYLVIIFTNIGGIGEFLSNVAGFVVPAYYSLVALTTSSSKDDTELLTYWVVFAFLNVIEFWSGAILYWIPFYWLIKTLFLLWLSSPSTGAAAVILRNFVKPFAQEYVLSKPAPKAADKPAEKKADKPPAAASGKSSAVAGN